MPRRTPESRWSARRCRASDRRRACPRSGGRRSRRRARAATPPPAPSAPALPGWRANRRGGILRCRRGRQVWPGSPRPVFWPARRFCLRRRDCAGHRQEVPSPVRRLAARTARESPGARFRARVIQTIYPSPPSWGRMDAVNASASKAASLSMLIVQPISMPCRYWTAISAIAHRAYARSAWSCRRLPRRGRSLALG